jgi:hypothetical protein
MNTSVNVHLHIPVSNLDSLRSALDALKEYSLLVGVPADEDRTGEGGPGSTARDDGEINNAALAYIHNNGSPSQNIPARPTLEPGILDAKDKITHRFEDGAKGALDGRKTAVIDNMTAAGLEAQTAVRNRIRSNTPPPLKEATLAARRRRGHTSTNTLLETGAYLASHSFVVRKNRG